MHSIVEQKHELLPAQCVDISEEAAQGGNCRGFLCAVQALKVLVRAIQSGWTEVWIGCIVIGIDGRKMVQNLGGYRRVLHHARRAHAGVACGMFGVIH